jgi:hypothetical protein
MKNVDAEWSLKLSRMRHAPLFQAFVVNFGGKLGGGGPRGGRPNETAAAAASYLPYNAPLAI